MDFYIIRIIGEKKRDFGDILLCYKNKLFTRYLSDPYIIILKVLGWYPLCIESNSDRSYYIHTQLFKWGLDFFLYILVYQVHVYTLILKICWNFLLYLKLWYVEIKIKHILYDRNNFYVILENWINFKFFICVKTKDANE